MILARVDVETVVTYHLERPITVDVLNGSGLGRRTIATMALRVRSQRHSRYLLAWATVGERAEKRGEWKRMPTTVEEALLRELDNLTSPLPRGPRLRLK